MLIQSIVLENFRAYEGKNIIHLATDQTKNLTIISGNNGYGKTTLLTSLVWCLYGKLMAEVDEKFRKEIYEAGGYKKYCEGIANRTSSARSFNVTLNFTKIFIPYIPCESVLLTRSIDIDADEEKIEILIDGKVNELTKTVGEEIFINDFILPKEIAKFFFFDAEKIVSLAEKKDIEERKSLSQAYSAVLGIKKYVDLKSNLENLRLRLRKKTYSKEDNTKLSKLEKQQSSNVTLIDHHDRMIREKESEILIKKAASDKLQEQLLRQGTSVTLEEIKEYKAMKDHLTNELANLKDRLKALQDLAPFAMVSKYLVSISDKLNQEQQTGNKVIIEKYLKSKISTFERVLNKNKKVLSLSTANEKFLLKLLNSTFLPNQEKDVEFELNFSPKEFQDFTILYRNLKNSYTQEFRHFVAEIKRQQSAYNLVNKKVADSEAKEGDPVIKRIRKDKIKLDEEIKALEEEVFNAKVEKTSLQNELKNINKQISELKKLIGVEKTDKAKDETAERLIRELDDFIHNLKTKKKRSLEKNILTQLKKLMHKTQFISEVEVVIEGDFIDIELYDSNKSLINKETLSKGEQQLYATAILKALIDESNIRFPVFIDSPLQKFDRDHARNIIMDFYPNISSQVVLFPLLDKELNHQEYQWLEPRIDKVYLLTQPQTFITRFLSISPTELANKFTNKVYA